MIPEEVELQLVEGALRAAIRARFPLGARVRAKAGTGFTYGTIEAHTGPEQTCRQILVLRVTPVTQKRARLRKPMTFWHDYRKLELVNNS